MASNPAIERGVRAKDSLSAYNFDREILAAEIRKLRQSGDQTSLLRVLQISSTFDLEYVDSRRRLASSSLAAMVSSAHAARASSQESHKTNSNSASWSGDLDQGGAGCRQNSSPPALLDALAAFAYWSCLAEMWVVVVFCDPGPERGVTRCCDAAPKRAPGHAWKGDPTC